MKNLFVLIMIIIMSFLYSSEYSDKPFSENIIMDKAEWTVDLVSFNNYLVDNIQTLPKENFIGLREHTFLLIDSILKNKFSENRNEFQEAETNSLSLLFNWGSKLELYGCDLIASEFKIDSNELVKSIQPDSSFNISFNFPGYTIKSELNNWSVTLPYYFMISKMTQFQTKYGSQSQYLKISTLFANHLQDEHYSQSTIALIVSPIEDEQKVIDFWLNAYKFNNKDPNPDFDLKYINYYEFDKESSMHKEITFINKDKCVFSLIYVGLDGTFQNNRIHYLDFINNLEIE